MRHRLPIVLSAVALAIAVLGFTPIAEGVKQQLVPPNSIGAAQLKTNAVRTVKIKNRQVTEEKIVLGAISTDLVQDGAVTPAKLAQTPAAGVNNSTNITIPSGTSQALTFNNERFDLGDVHEAGSSRLRAPIAGVYVVAGNVNFSGANGIGQRRVEIRRNGEAIVASVQVEATSVNQTQLGISKVILLAEGDYLELLAFQNSGADLAVLQEGQFSPEFNIAWVGTA
jgi:hypothetical protein